MSLLITFAIAFAFSFVGTIPPGTLNLSVLQMGLNDKMKSALWFSFGAAIVEYPYAWLGVTFEELITSSPAIVNNFERIGAVVMLTLGVINLIGLRNQKLEKIEPKGFGFTKGIILGVLNPLAMPYWIGVTAYLRSQHWVDIHSTFQLHAYLTGVSLGALAFLILLALLARRISFYFQGNSVINYIPAATLLLLGIYSLISSFV